MKTIYIIANWKSNKTKGEVDQWLTEIAKSKGQKEKIGKEIIVCPSFLHLSQCKQLISEQNLPFKLGAQNISPFSAGAYTGEINGEQLKDHVSHVIIGHSERRNHFGESNEIVFKKVIQAITNNLTPIVCVSNIDQVHDLTERIENYEPKLTTANLLIAYEPLFAIGSGQADSPENANNLAQTIKKEMPSSFVLYGGSVTSQNVKTFIDQPYIDGVLVGGASLKPLEFSQIVQNA